MGYTFFHYSCILCRNAGKIVISKYWSGQRIDRDIERNALETACDTVFQQHGG